MTWSDESPFILFFTYFSAGPVVTHIKKVTGNDGIKVSANNVHSIAKILFPAGIVYFRTISVPNHTARPVKSSFEKHDDEV